MIERAKRDRPAAYPGGMVCDECSEVFIGADWHSYCGVCVEIVSNRETAARAAARAPEQQMPDRKNPT